MVTYERAAGLRSSWRGPLTALVLLLGAGLVLWLTLGTDGGPAPPARQLPDGLPAPADGGVPRDGVPLSVMLLEPDMATRAPGRTLAIFRYTPRRMERPELVRELTTDALGVARLTALEPGSYIVCAPGATPSSPSPSTARATLEPGAVPITRYVVEPELTVPVTLSVQADFAPREGVAVRIVCRRRDGGARFRSREALVPGASRLELALPPGRYDVEVEPIGELDVHPETRVLQVEPTVHSARVSLAENPARIDVRLSGLPPSAFPVRVYPQRVDQVLDDRPQQEWWGPLRWPSAQAIAPAIDGERRLLVFSRTELFRSRRPIELDGDRTTVELEPAVRLVVDWFGWEPRRDDGAVLAAETGEDWIARTLVPRFGDGHPELDRPALGGELVVARGGTARLVCTRPDASVAWERVVALDAPLVSVRIE